MRAARSKTVLNPKTGRSRTVYYGGFRFQGKQYWVPGNYETAKAWERASERIKAKADAERLQAQAADADLAAPTLAKFAGARVDKTTGRLITDWPESHPKLRRKKASSVRRAKEAIRPLIRAFGDRRAHEIPPSEAYEFLLTVGANTRQHSAQLFDDLIRLHPAPGVANPFRGHELPPRRKRKTNPEFRILTNEEFDRLVMTAGKVRTDDYGLIQKALVTAMGTSCSRPGELFALRYERLPRLANGVAPGWIDFDAEEIHLTSQIDDRGEEVLPKDNEERVVVLPPPMKEAILAAPRISDYVFPAIRGGRLRVGLWDSHYWPAIRAAFGDPKLEFYELKHRAITWCCTSISGGGLGLDPATVAHQAGHNDGGLTIAKYYLKLDEQLARRRIREAMDAHARAVAAARNGQPPLRAVGS
jgi:integrase